jgi:acyl-CoA thioesterase
MGNLADDTALRRDGDEWTAGLSADWEIWGPNGGYLAAIALRAAGAHSGLDRPASFTCHYLGVAQFEEMRFRTKTLRGSSRAESVQVVGAQADRTILAGLAWVVAEELEGLSCDAAPPPEVPAPSVLSSTEQLPREAPPAEYPFWSNLENRPISWFPPGGQNEPAGRPEVTNWMRFRPQPVFDDPFVDAGRLLILLDTMCWPAANRAHARRELAYIAPSLDVAATFHRLEPRSEWLLVQATSPVAADGLVGGRSAVWSESGRLLASAVQQMLCRPVPPGGDRG